MEYAIVHKTQGWKMASGFYTLERAEKWIASFNPQIWMDKTLTKGDCVIVQERNGKRLTPCVKGEVA